MNTSSSGTRYRDSARSWAGTPLTSLKLFTSSTTSTTIAARPVELVRRNSRTAGNSMCPWLTMAGIPSGTRTVILLEGNPVAQRSQVVSQMEQSGWPHARKNDPFLSARCHGQYPIFSSVNYPVLPPVLRVWGVRSYSIVYTQGVRPITCVKQQLAESFVRERLWVIARYQLGPRHSGTRRNP